MWSSLETIGRSRRWKVLSLTLTGVAVASMVTACGSSASSSSAPTTVPTSSSTTGATPTAAATKGTIQVGFANMDTGTISFPAILQAADAAAAYLNKTKGGLDGRTLQLVSCDMKNDDQSAQECGQKFANDPTMPFAMLGATLNGGPFYAAMEAAHKPVLGALGVVPADYSPKNVYFYYPGSNFYASLGTYLTSLHAHSYALIYSANASAEYGETVIARDLTSAGATVKASAVPAAASDLTPSIATAGIASADVTAIVTNGDCPQIVTAMSSLGLKPKKVVTVDSCVSGAQLAATPAAYQGWTYYNNFKVAAAGSAGGPQVVQFLKGWSEYGPGGIPGTWAELGWGLTLTAASVFAGAPAITSTSASKALADYRGDVDMGPTSVHCPGPAPYTSTCAEGAQVYTINNGKLFPIAS